MSIESLAPCTEVPAPSRTPLPVTEPAPARAPSGPTAEAAAIPLPLQERRLRVARELEARINCLEQDIRQIGDTLARSRASTTGSLRELQQRSTSLTTELLRVGARLAQQGGTQEKNTRHLEHRLGSRLQEIEGALAALTAELRAQTEGQHELQQRHECLQRLHEHLDRIVNRQGRNLDILSAEFQQRVELLRVSFEALQEVFHAQQESLIGLTLEHEQLALLTRQLQVQLGELGTRLDLHVDHMRQRLRSQAMALAILTLLSIGMITYFQLNPVTIPDDVTAQLNTLTNDLVHQRNQARKLSAQSRLQDERLASLSAALETERQETRRLRQQARRTAGRLARLDRKLDDLRHLATPALAAPADAPPSTTAEAWPPAQAPDHIATPTVVSGSRPSF